MTYLSKINPQHEVEKITSFLKKTFVDQKIEKAIIGVSGGIDSAVCFCLLSLVLPKENIIPLYLPFFQEQSEKTEIKTISIKTMIEEEAQILGIDLKSENFRDKIRLGNLMARTRMMILFDFAQKNHALVCGTENKTENLLGYFTRFGDAASDIEPISHLYKTQIREIAKFLKISDEIINQPPSAGLWAGQTDEDQFGFSYEEADQVLFLFFEKKYDLQKIKNMGFARVESIINLAKNNHFKHKTPYSMKKER